MINVRFCTYNTRGAIDVYKYVTDILKHTKPKPKSKYNLMEETPLYALFKISHI